MMNSRREEKKEFEYKAQEEEVVVSENVLPALMTFINSDGFRREVDTFTTKYSRLFHENHRNEHKTGDVLDQEWTHEHKEAFDCYQETLEDLFSVFAKQQGVTLGDIYVCCQDTAEGKFAPLFGEDENQYIVDRIMAFLDFDKFILSMKRRCNEVSNSHK